MLLGAYQQGGTFTNSLGGEGHVSNSGGVGGGFIYQYDLPKSWGRLSFVQLAALYGWGLVDFDRSQVDLNKLSSAYNSALAAQGLAPNSAFADIDPFNNSQRARANIFWVWNPTDNFSMGTWATYQFDDQGFTSYRVNSDGSISSASPYSNISLPLESGLFTGYGVPSRFKVPSDTPISQTIESRAQGLPLVKEARWGSSQLPRPSNQEAAFLPVRSCASTRPTRSGLIRSKGPSAVLTTATPIRDGTSESRRSLGGERQHDLHLTKYSSLKAIATMKAQQVSNLLLGVVVCAVFALVGCASMKSASEESLLQKAGFQARTPTTEKQKAAYAALPAYQVHKGTMKGKTVYALRGREKAGVVYIGNTAQYAQYKQLAANAQIQRREAGRS